MFDNKTKLVEKKRNNAITIKKSLYLIFHNFSFKKQQDYHQQIKETRLE